MEPQIPGPWRWWGRRIKGGWAHYKEMALAHDERSAIWGPIVKALAVLVPAAVATWYGATIKPLLAPIAGLGVVGVAWAGAVLHSAWAEYKKAEEARRTLQGPKDARTKILTTLRDEYAAMVAQPSKNRSGTGEQEKEIVHRAIIKFQRAMDGEVSTTETDRILSMLWIERDFWPDDSWWIWNEHSFLQRIEIVLAGGIPKQTHGG